MSHAMLNPFILNCGRVLRAERGGEVRSASRRSGSRSHFRHRAQHREFGPRRMPRLRLGSVRLGRSFPPGSSASVHGAGRPLAILAVGRPAIGIEPWRSGSASPGLRSSSQGPSPRAGLRDSIRRNVIGLPATVEIRLAVVDRIQRVRMMRDEASRGVATTDTCFTILTRVDRARPRRTADRIPGCPDWRSPLTYEDLRRHFAGGIECLILQCPSPDGSLSPCVPPCCRSLTWTPKRPR